MKVLVFSDTHRDLKAVQHILSAHGREIHQVLHLGDHIEDMQKLSLHFPEISFHGVRGNCDFDPSYPDEQILTLLGHRILLTHGHLYGVKGGYLQIHMAAREKAVQLCLFGHTHQPVTFEQDGIQFMNPGSVSLPRKSGFPSYGVLEVEEEKLRCTVVGCIDGFYRPVDVGI